MKKGYILLLVFWMLFSIPVITYGQNHEREKISKLGLTLSGGGAKGLAHIGVLMVLDSLGIQAEVVTGTSMGSIIGGMYASGYTPAEIEQFALNMDWDKLFSAKSSLDNIPPQDRENYAKSLAEVSLYKGKIILPTGAIEGQQLWNTLNELFLHEYKTTDFNQMTIPFACVATDVETGLPVVLNNGNLTSAIRASMAIPSIFTTVFRDERKLIDGGVVKNFPVSVARDMGADYIIGVNVSQGLRKADELNTPVDIIYQMGFYVDAHNFIYDKQLTNILIEPDLTGYSAASFNEAAGIIKRGKEAAMLKIDELSQLAGQYKIKQNKTPAIRQQYFIIDSIKFVSRGKEVKPSHYRKMGIKAGDTVKAQDITRAVNRLYATDNYNRIQYTLVPDKAKNKNILIFELTHKPDTRLMAGVNYSTFNGVGIMAGWRKNQFLLPNAQAYAKVLIGKNPAVSAGISAFLNDTRKSWASLRFDSHRFEFPLFENFRRVSEYKQTRTNTSLSYNLTTGKNSYLSVGSDYFYQYLKPRIESELSLKGSVKGFETHLQWNYFSLDRNLFPQSGRRIMLRSSLFHNQNPNLTVLLNEGQTSSVNELDIKIENFIQTYLLWESYRAFNTRLSSVKRMQFGYNFLYKQGFLNSFNVGGTSLFLNRQVTFSGLNEYEILTNSIFTLSYGLQYNLGKNIYLSGNANAGAYSFDFKELKKITYNNNGLLGAALGVGYASPLGPIEITFSYSPQTDKIIGYVNLGWVF